MPETPKMLMTVVGKDRSPTLASAAEQLGIKPEDIDAAYGVVPVDLGQQLYAVLVRADRLPAGRAGEPYRGPFSNPKIGSFGEPPDKE